MSYGRVTFKLDGRGIVLNRAEWLHLDGLLAWAALYSCGRELAEIPTVESRYFKEPELPLDTVTVNGEKIYATSALFLEGDIKRTVRWYRKRFNMERAPGLTTGTVLTGGGPYRDANQAADVTLCSTVMAWFSGDVEMVRELLTHIRALGKHRAIGFGRVVETTVEEIAEDRSVVFYGNAMRYYPDARGWRVVRPRPPYWNLTGAINCLDPGVAV